MRLNINRTHLIRFSAALSNEGQSVHMGHQFLFQVSRGDQ